MLDDPFISIVNGLLLKSLLEKAFSKKKGFDSLRATVLCKNMHLTSLFPFVYWMQTKPRTRFKSHGIKPTIPIEIVVSRFSRIASETEQFDTSLHAFPWPIFQVHSSILKTFLGAFSYLQLHQSLRFQNRVKKVEWKRQKL